MSKPFLAIYWLVVRDVYFLWAWCIRQVDYSWNVMAHGDAREEKWRGNWWMLCVAITLHTTSEHGVSSITTADAHTSTASIRLNWRPPGRFKWTRPFHRKTKSGFCACAITFQLASKTKLPSSHHVDLSSSSNLQLFSISLKPIPYVNGSFCACFVPYILQPCFFILNSQIVRNVFETTSQI